MTPCARLGPQTSAGTGVRVGSKRDEGTNQGLHGLSAALADFLYWRGG